MNFGYPIHELEDSPKETFGQDGAKITRRFLIPWNKRIDFAIKMTSVFTGVGQGPAAYPAYPFAIVDSIENAPFTKKPDQFTMTDPTTQVNSFTSDDRTCLSIVTYSTRKSQTNTPQDDGVPNGTYCTYRQRAAGEFLLVEGRGLEWYSGTPGVAGVPVGQDKHTSILVPITDHIVTWHKVVDPPWGEISKNKGKVSGEAYKIKGQKNVYAEETILFESCESDTEYKVDLTQPQTWTLTYTFKERRLFIIQGGVNTTVGWNHLYRWNASGAGGSGQWERPIVAGTNATPTSTNKYMYQTATNAEFQKLFQFNQAP